MTEHAAKPQTDWTPERVNSLRTGLGWTKEQFSRAVGVSARTILAWESGDRNVSRIVGKVLDTLASTDTPADPADLTSTGERLREALRSRGLTMTEVADRAGMSKQQCYHLVSGSIANPRPETLQRLADAIGIDVADLTGPDAGE